MRIERGESAKIVFNLKDNLLSHSIAFFWAMDLVATPSIILVCNSCSKSQVHWLAAGWAEHDSRYVRGKLIDYHLVHRSR